MSNNYVKLFSDDMKNMWQKLNITQKFGILALIIATVAVATFFFMKATEPNWTVLYSDLSETDTVAIIESLKKGGYPYKLSSDKTAILVPAEKQDELRVMVAENDLIKDGSPGFELLDDLQLGSTEFKNKLTRQRIFQGEITRSIEKMHGIKKARVQIAEPERSVFTDKDESPTASVMLIMDPGYRLKVNQIKAIKNLVAYSIPRLTPEKVFLTDQNGNTLSDDIQKNSGDIESFRQNFEIETGKKIQQVLDKIVGKDNASVQVSADIDFNSAKATIESYIPVGENGQGVVTSSQSEIEAYEKPNAVQTVTQEETEEKKTETGEIKEEEKITTKPVGKNLTYQKQKNATNYSVSKEIKQIVYAPGTVKRMTIAVAVNKILTQKEKEELEKLVISASGANTERGDIINISSMEFVAGDAQNAQSQKLLEEAKKEATTDLIVSKVIPLVVVLILGLVALFVLKALLPKRAEGGGSSMDTSSQAWADPAAQQLMYKETLPPITDELADMLEVESLPQIEAKLDPVLERMKNDLNETILSDPQEAARLLISYIKD